jgi:Flp pilus assembly protein TadD
MLPPENVTLTASQLQRFATACSFLSNGKIAQAMALANGLIKQAPDAADAWHLLGMCHAERGDIALAESAFESALARSPENFLILSNYAAWQMRLGRHVQATALLRRAATANPHAAQPLIQLGLLALDEKGYSQAESYFRKALEIAADALPAWHGLGNALREQGNLQAAERAFLKAVSLAPDYAPAWVNLGSIQRLQGRPEDALQSYQKACDAGQTGAALEDSINGALIDIGQVEEALNRAHRLVATHPGYAPGHATLANLLWQYRSRSSSAENPLQGFEQAALAQPHNRELQLLLIRTLLEARRADSALSHVQSLYRKDPSDPVAQWLLADTNVQLGQLEQAEFLYQQAYRQLATSSPSFLNAYARHALQLQRWQQAEQLSSASLRIDRTNQEGWANLAIAWRMQGDSREYWLCDYERLIAAIDIPTPDGYADIPAFLYSLRASLDTLHLATREPINQSVRHGSQTQGRLFGRDDPAIIAARTALTGAVEKWLSSLPDDPHHPFLARKPPGGKVSVTGSWSVKLWSSGHHANHIHPRGWISSAFYVGLPPSVLSQSSDHNAGCIQFGQPLERLGLHLPARRIIHPKPGKLAVFPSYMWHGTVPFVDEQPRMTIAFDMCPQS